jgi:hypothetical protein
MSKNIIGKALINFSSSQHKGNYTSSSNKNNISNNKKVSNKGLIFYLKNSRNKIEPNIKNSKTNKSINNKSNKSKIKVNDFLSKTFELESNKKVNNNNKTELYENKSTFKIDYRHFKKYPLNDIIPMRKFENDNDKLFWLATYDKLIKTKKILKILNYTNFIGEKNISSKPIYTEASLKIKTMKIPNFEIFFVKGYDKPFVRPNKDKNSFILTKLYLLTKKEINKIINFINRTEDTINIDNYSSISQKNLFQYMENKKNSDINNTNFDVNYPYCYIYYLGKFMNITIYLFTNSFYDIKSYNINNSIIYSLPSSKKLYKLIKVIIKTFPEYNPEFIINYIINFELYQNSKEKKFEIYKYLSILKPSAPNKYLLNKILRETITGIQTNSSISYNSLQVDSNEQLKTSEQILKDKKIIGKQNSDENKNSIPIGYKFEIKSSLNSMNNFLLNGQIGNTNLSTNHTMLPSNSIRTLSNKNSFGNNIPILNIPYEVKNNVKRDTFVNHYKTKNLFIGNNLMPKKNLDVQDKKISCKNLVNKIKNKDGKENIDINNVLNKKKNDKILNNKKISKDPINNDDLNKKKKNENKKPSKEEGKNEYHTPKKRKKIKYYK